MWMAWLPQMIFGVSLRPFLREAFTTRHRHNRQEHGDQAQFGDAVF